MANMHAFSPSEANDIAPTRLGLGLGFLSMLLCVVAVVVALMVCSTFGIHDNMLPEGNLSHGISLLWGFLVLGNSGIQQSGVEAQLLPNVLNTSAYVYNCRESPQSSRDVASSEAVPDYTFRNVASQADDQNLALSPQFSSCSPLCSTSQAEVQSMAFSPFKLYCISGHGSLDHCVSNSVFDVQPISPDMDVFQDLAD